MDEETNVIFDITPDPNNIAYLKYLDYLYSRLLEHVATAHEINKKKKNQKIRAPRYVSIR